GCRNRAQSVAVDRCRDCRSTGGRNAHTSIAERLRWALAEERLVLARETAQLVEPVRDRDVGDRSRWMTRRAKRAPRLMELPQPKIAHRARGVDVVERVAQVAFADACRRRELGGRHALAEMTAEELLRAPDEALAVRRHVRVFLTPDRVPQT